MKTFAAIAVAAALCAGTTVQADQADQAESDRISRELVRDIDATETLEHLRQQALDEIRGSLFYGFRLLFSEAPLRVAKAKRADSH